MGSFSTIVHNCPNCGNVLESQSKSGECRMGVYNETEVPLTIASGVIGDELHCGKCDTSWRVTCKKETVKLKLKPI